MESSCMRQVNNFNAGPAALPEEVLLQIQDELLDLQGTRLSVLEISHRSKAYEKINVETQQILKELLNIPPDYEVLFLQGGASTQFAMVPMNFLVAGSKASYIQSGTWAEKAIDEARKFGEIVVSGSSEDDSFKRIPQMSKLEIDPESAYIHLTSNETILGTQYQNFINTGTVPLIADMSSDILSRQIDVANFSLIYAGAQKNLGPSGVTVVIVKRDMLENIPDNIPNIMNYRIHANSNSLYHTPPVFAVYVVNLMVKWIQKNGGITTIEKLNNQKAELLYSTIDHSNGFYQGLVHADSRSKMNVTFSIFQEEMEKIFLQEAKNNGFVGLKGHRDTGHLRVSIYNAVTYEHCQALVEFMTDFQKRHG